MEPLAHDPHVDRRIADLAARQHGVVSRAQLERAGLTDGAIRARLRVRRLIPLHRGVYAVGHDHLTHAGRWMAAVLAGGPGAVLSHRSAAALWELRPPSAGAVDILLAGRHKRGPRGVTVHRTRRLTAHELTSKDGIPVTTAARTLLDLAEAVPRRTLVRAVEEAEVRELFDLAQLRAAIAANPGRSGGVILGAVLSQERIGETVTRSELEDAFLSLVARLGFPAPATNVRLAGCEAHFLWRDQRLVVETDGYRFHRTAGALDRDRAKDLDLAAAGYRVLRFSYRQVMSADPRVERALAARLPRG
jgi:hypothetical protein